MARFPFRFSVPENRRVSNAALANVGADFWEGDPTKHFSVKKKGVFSEKGEGFSE